MIKKVMTVGLLMSGWGAGVMRAEGDLAAGFASPPASARPWVYWTPLSGNLRKDGITADFEAMARVGIGGVVYIEVEQGVPKGPADFAGPQWRELFRHACREASRLGLKITMNNDAGWCGSGGPWITPELSMQKVVWSEAVVEGGREFAGELARPSAVNGYYRDIAVLAMPVPGDDTYRLKDLGIKMSFPIREFTTTPASFPDAPPDAVIPRDKIMDVSAKMDAAGKLTWDVPAGKWRVMRLGCTTTGKTNHPAPESGCGLECDKFNKEAVATHYDRLIRKLVADNQAYVGQGKALVSTHIDSWEVGGQTWTPRMREEFKQRRGYDLLAWLPAFSGRVIDSVEVTERFLWDLRQTFSDLIVANYAGELRRLANHDGLRLSIEAYGQVQVDELAYASQADDPMCEFWWREKYAAAHSCLTMSSAAHIYGKKVLSAEAFTSDEEERWLGHPAAIKDLGDWAFCEGINRFVFHRFAAQPWTNVAPGMAMGAWGLHYERTQTWWEQSKAWHEYVARCQYLLQQGLFVADVLYLQAEGAPRRVTLPEGAEIAPHIRGGYNYDGCTSDALLTRVTVRDGLLVLPDGMSYRVLVLPEVGTMTPRLLRKIKEFVEAGATVIGGAKPPEQSPALADTGAGDTEVNQLAAGLWPKLATGKTAAALLAERGVKPDFSATPVLRYTHRTIGDAEIYFVANPEPRDVEALASFRVAGKLPELWWPDSGRVERAVAFEVKDGLTTVPLRLEPSGSLFVVFRKSAAEMDPVVSVTRNGERVLPSTSVSGNGESPVLDIARGEIWQGGEYVMKTAGGKNRQVSVSLPPAQEIAGPWEVAFDPQRGGPGKVTFERLEDWARRPEDGIRYYSGTAEYRINFSNRTPEAGSRRKVYLDLGRVAVMAEVKLNNRNLGILWKPPYRVDVTGTLKNGDNRLEVKVVNLWVNRQIGDERLPEDSARNEDGTLKSWPQWFAEGKPSPTGRFTFSTWRLWQKNEPLVESGLMGPVTLRAVAQIPAEKH